MAHTTTYLNFNRNTEEAFNFYKHVFETEITKEMRFVEMELPAGSPPLSDDDKLLIMHIEMPIWGGHILAGTDAAESMGFELKVGNNFSINLECDTTEEADSLFAKLSTNGEILMAPAKSFWGTYFGHCVDKFGIQWMVHSQLP